MKCRKHTYQAVDEREIEKYRDPEYQGREGETLEYEAVCSYDIDAECEKEGSVFVPVTEMEPNFAISFKKLRETIFSDKELCSKDNFIDRGAYIELRRPIGDIHMIEKGQSPSEMTSEDALKYSNQLNFKEEFGGFGDWRIPTREEFQVICMIKDLCGIEGNWSSPYLWRSGWGGSCGYVF